MDVPAASTRGDGDPVSPIRPHPRRPLPCLRRCRCRHRQPLSTADAHDPSPADFAVPPPYRPVSSSPIAFELTSNDGPGEAILIAANPAIGLPVDELRPPGAGTDAAGDRGRHRPLHPHQPGPDAALDRLPRGPGRLEQGLPGGRAGRLCQLRLDCLVSRACSCTTAARRRCSCTWPTACTAPSSSTRRAADRRPASTSSSRASSTVPGGEYSKMLSAPPDFVVLQRPGQPLQDDAAHRHGRRARPHLRRERRPELIVRVPRHRRPVLARARPTATRRTARACARPSTSRPATVRSSSSPSPSRARTRSSPIASAMLRRARSACSRSAEPIAAAGKGHQVRLELTRRGDYAVRAMLALAHAAEGSSTAGIPPNGRLSAARIADMEGIPPRILPSVMVRLVRAGLVTAETGRAGGYRLARRADQINLLDVIEAVGGRHSPAGLHSAASTPDATGRTIWRRGPPRARVSFVSPNEWSPPRSS